jgi:hypothetical protein
MPLRRKKILALHRWLGLLSALFLISLSITGLMLNHTERLGLDQIRINNALLLKCYGMQVQRDLQTYRIHERDTLTHLNDQIYYNARPLASSGAPLTFFENDHITVVACPQTLILLSPYGELVEAIDHTKLPFEKLSAAGYDPQGDAVLVAENGLWKPDPAWLQFQPYTGAYTVNALPIVTLSENATTAILAHHQGQGLSLYRVLLDLHAGRLFGWGGRTLMDLTAIAVLILISSGLTSWFKKSRRA